LPPFAFIQAEITANEKEAPRRDLFTPERLFGHDVKLNGFDVFCGRALLALRNIETDALALGQGLETAGLNGAVMDKQIPTAVFLDKPEALLLIEPLHCTF
jgi:hypothetical protein